MSTSIQLLIGVGVLALIGLVSVWTAGARTGRKVERAVVEATHTGATGARSLVTGIVLVGIQWAVLTATTDPLVWAAALGVPALLAGVTVGRLLGITDLLRTNRPANHRSATRRTRTRGGRG